MNPCPPPERLRALLADALSAGEAGSVEAHVEGCATCQQALERLTDRPALERTRLDTGGEPPDGAVREVQLAPARKTGLHRADEVRALLHQRLRVAATGLVVIPVVYLLFLLLTTDFSRNTDNPLVTWGRLLPRVVFTAVAAVPAVILWRNRSLSLGWLRALELALFAFVILFFSLGQYASLRSPDLVDYLVLRREPPLLVFARYALFGWFLLMVLYATFIPNTGRRCLLVLGVMGLAPLAVTAAAGSAEGVEAGPLLRFLAESAGEGAVAVAVAAYGAYRIEVHRARAAEAHRVGPYRLLRRLGAGGMGEVYLAEHALLRRPCAVKVIRPERAGDPQNLSRFEREVRATAALTHPNTVEVYDYGHADDGTFYYAMEYLPGLSLEDLVQRHDPLPPGRAVHLLRQVCGALGEAHAAGLVHRDVKPGNVLVCARGGRHDVAKLLDFGLVQAHGLEEGTEKLTRQGAIAGTPAFMSPEQAAGHADVDGRSDLYSLGAVAYYLLTGRPPFERQTVVQTLAAHLGEPPLPPDRHRPDVPADLQAVVLRCLEKDPARRFADAGELDRALAGCACAGGWTSETAAGWWRERTRPEEKSTGRCQVSSPDAD
jgi:serine/threonine-protein kinase